MAEIGTGELRVAEAATGIEVIETGVTEVVTEGGQGHETEVEVATGTEMIGIEEMTGIGGVGKGRLTEGMIEIDGGQGPGTDPIDGGQGQSTENVTETVVKEAPAAIPLNENASEKVIHQENLENFRRKLQETLPEGTQPPGTLVNSSRREKKGQTDRGNENLPPVNLSQELNVNRNLRMMITRTLTLSK